MGDSLSRYFYLSLAHMLAHQKWPRKFARLPSHPTHQDSIVSERDWSSWTRFYSETNRVMLTGFEEVSLQKKNNQQQHSRSLEDTVDVRILNTTTSRPHLFPNTKSRRISYEVCDCFRDDSLQWMPNGTGPHQ
jgi:hypothetical protein